MLKRLDLYVSPDLTSVLFTLPAALHVLTFAVSSEAGDTLWKLLPEGAQPMAIENGRFWSTPVPAEMIATGDAETAALADTEHVVPMLRTITYGEVPAGYKAAQVASPLRRGETYRALFIAEEGHGSAAFTVRDAAMSNGSNTTY